MNDTSLLKKALQQSTVMVHHTLSRSWVVGFKYHGMIFKQEYDLLHKCVCIYIHYSC